MILHSWQQSSYSLFTHEIGRVVNLFRTSTFFRSPSLDFLQIVLCFILGLVLFHKIEVWIVSKALKIWLGTVAVRAWKTIICIAKLLKSSVLEATLRKLDYSFILLS